MQIWRNTCTCKCSLWEQYVQEHHKGYCLFFPVPCSSEMQLKQQPAHKRTCLGLLLLFKKEYRIFIKIELKWKIWTKLRGTSNFFFYLVSKWKKNNCGKKYQLGAGLAVPVKNFCHHIRKQKNYWSRGQGSHWSLVFALMNSPNSLILN